MTHCLNVLASMRLSPRGIAYEIERPPNDFRVDPVQIFANDPRHQELQPEEQRHRQHRARPAEDRMAYDSVIKEIAGHGNGQQRYGSAGDRHDSDWRLREANECVVHRLDHPAVGPTRPAGLTTLSSVFDDLL